MVSFGRIEIEELVFRIGSFALENVTLAIQPGEYFVLTGANGAGKSLLMQLICGLYRPVSGVIRVNGQVLEDLPPWKRQMGYVPQDGVLFPNRSVRNNIVFGLEVRKTPKGVRREAVDRIARLLRIEHLLDRLPRGLSGGERQKVSLARALVLRPHVLLLDEPVSAIDETARDAVCRELHRIQRTLGITTVHISHNQTETRLLADRIGVMHQGRLVSIEKTEGNAS